MQKLPVYIVATAVLTLSPQVLADRFFGVYLGGGIWQHQFGGTAGEPAISLNELGAKDTNDSFYYLALEHPVPLVPNVRLQRTNVSHSQSAVISQSFTLNDITFDAETQVESDFDLGHTDLTLYYQLLDNWVNVDLGLTVRHFDGYARASSTTLRSSEKLDELIPLAYLHAQFDLPLTGFSLGLSGQGISYSDSRVTDMDVYLRYTLDSAMDIAVNLGYRSLALRLDEKEIQADAELDGPYAGILLHF